MLLLAFHAVPGVEVGATFARASLATVVDLTPPPDHFGLTGKEQKVTRLVEDIFSILGSLERSQARFNRPTG